MLREVVLFFLVFLQVSIYGYRSISGSVRNLPVPRSFRSIEQRITTKINLQNGDNLEEELKKEIQDIGGGSGYERKTGFDSLKQLFSWKESQSLLRNSTIGYVPLYKPGSYPRRALASLAYLIPLIDAADLGKYMFEAYPEVGSLYNTLFAPFLAIYNGVPFFPFAVFFALAYIARGPQFPTEIRFHISQALVLSLLQVIPSLIFPFMERAGVPGMAVFYNTMFLFVILSCINMQSLLLLPFGNVKNPLILNTLSFTLSVMNYEASPLLKRVNFETKPEPDDKL